MKKNALYLASVLLLCSCGPKSDYSAFLAGETSGIPVWNLDRQSGLQAIDTLPRGTELQISAKGACRNEGVRYLPARLGRKKFYVDESALADDRRACVLEKELFVQTSASLIDDTLSSHINGFARKTQKLQVLDYDRLQPDGRVNRYYVKCGNRTGWIFGKYTVLTQEEAAECYDVFDEAHRAVKNSFKGGEASGCEFRPYEKPVFADNPMPDPVNAFYLTISPSGLKHIDEYIALADSTNINAFVIDIKDNECPGYKAEAMEKYSPTNYKWAGANKEKLYKEAIDKLHDKGYYVIGRITCFKDSYYAKDHPGSSICEKATGQPFLHNKSYWPSAYSRDVWQFNVELAKESVRKFGLNEVNFDYVRFPDKMISIDEQMDYRNSYGESKVQAIQNFVRYACDELHQLGVYVSDRKSVV